MELVLTGRNISAQEASDWGMVSRVVSEGDGEVVKEAVKIAKEIASKSQIAVQGGKEAVNSGMYLSNFLGIRALQFRLQHTSYLWLKVCVSKGGHFMVSLLPRIRKKVCCGFHYILLLRIFLGMAAFVEKRKPNFGHL